MAEKSCFVIAPIGEMDSHVRRRSDQLLRHLIRPVVEPLGYTVHRADELHDEGLITNHVIERVIESDLVIADLAGRNPNVFYELAVRHAARNPVVHLNEHGEDIPFDVANMRAIAYSLTDLDLVDQAREELKRKVEAIEQASATAPNPITAAVDLQALRASGDPGKERLAEVLDAVDDLRTEVRSLGTRLGANRHVSDPLSPVREGAAVDHAGFGWGRVTAVEPGGVVVVRFADGTERKLMWNLAPITVLAPPETSDSPVEQPEDDGPKA